MAITGTQSFQLTNPALFENSIASALEEENLQLDDLSILVKNIWNRSYDFLDSQLEALRISKKVSGLQRTFYLKKNNSSELQIQIYGKKILGKGAFKKIKTSYQVTIKPNSPIYSTKIARIQIRGQYELDQIRQGIKALKSIPDYQKFNIAGDLIHIESYQTPFSLKFESSDLLYDESFEKTLRNTNISFESTLQHLTYVQECCDFLSHIHSHGFVHGDFKSSNLLLLNKKIYIGDFDLTSPFGVTSPLDPPYFYADSLHDKGIITPLSDIHGLSILLGEVVFEIHEFYNLFASTSNSSSNEEKTEQIKNTKKDPVLSFEKEVLGKQQLNNILISDSFYSYLVKSFNKLKINTLQLTFLRCSRSSPEDRYNKIVDLIKNKISVSFNFEQKVKLEQLLKMTLIRKKTLEIIQDTYEENNKYYWLLSNDKELVNLCSSIKNDPTAIKAIAKHLQNYYSVITDNTYIEKFIKKLNSLLLFISKPLPENEKFYTEYKDEEPFTKEENEMSATSDENKESFTKKDSDKISLSETKLLKEFESLMTLTPSPKMPPVAQEAQITPQQKEMTLTPMPPVAQITPQQKEMTLTPMPPQYKQTIFSPKNPRRIKRENTPFKNSNY